MDQTYRIFTDGSAIGNPGPGGWGVVVIQGKERWEISGAHPWTTISEMELVAAVQALRSVEGRGRLELYSDSEYLIYGMRICLPQAAPRLAKPARNRTAAPRIVDGADPRTFGVEFDSIAPNSCVARDELKCSSLSGAWVNRRGRSSEREQRAKFHPLGFR